MILAADFGGTTIKLGLVQAGRVIARDRIDAGADRPMTERLEAVARAGEALLQGQGRGLADCTGLALALPFLTDPRQLRVHGEFGKFPGATAIDFGAWSRRRLGLPVALENDLRVALLGEWAAGAGRGKDTVVMLALGTGIGCAAMTGGRLLCGANNRAGTLLGHATVDWDGETGRCGNPGCAEDLASTATLAARAAERADFAGSRLAGAGKIDFAKLFLLADEGDACSQAVLQQCLRVWSVVVQNAVLAYDPDVVVLGGGVLRRADIVLPAMRQQLQKQLTGLTWATPVVAATLADDAALLGGEVLFRQAHPGL